MLTFFWKAIYNWMWINHYFDLYEYQIFLLKKIPISSRNANLFWLRVLKWKSIMEEKYVIIPDILNRDNKQPSQASSRNHKRPADKEWIPFDSGITCREGKLCSTRSDLYIHYPETVFRRRKLWKYLPWPAFWIALSFINRAPFWSLVLTPVSQIKTYTRI